MRKLSLSLMTRASQSKAQLDYAGRQYIGNLARFENGIAGQPMVRGG